MKFPLNTQHAATAPMAAPKRMLRRGFRCFLVMRMEGDNVFSTIVDKDLSDLSLLTSATSFPLFDVTCCDILGVVLTISEIEMDGTSTGTLVCSFSVVVCCSDELSSEVADISVAAFCFLITLSMVWHAFILLRKIPFKVRKASDKV